MSKLQMKANTPTELGEKDFLPPEDYKLCSECGFAEWRHGFGSSHQFNGSAKPTPTKEEKE